MPDIQPYSALHGPLAADARRAGRAISRSRASSQVRGALINDETDVALDKIDSITAVTGQGLSAVVRVGQAQQQLELLAPATSARLNLLADNHVLGVADVQADHQRTLRRR